VRNLRVIEQQCAVHGRDRDAFDDCAVAGMQGADVVDGDAFLPGPGAAGNGHIDGGGARGPNPPQRRRVAVAEDRIESAGQNRGHPPALAVQPPVTDGVHAALEAVEAT